MIQFTQNLVLINYQVNNESSIYYFYQTTPSLWG